LTRNWALANPANTTDKKVAVRYDIWPGLRLA
jgi:hypothetical protein